MLTNILIVTIVLIFTILGAFRGLAKSMLNFVGFVLSAVVANFLSSNLSQWIYATFLKRNIIQNLTDIANQNSVSYTVNNCFDALPNWMHGIVSFIMGIFGGNTNDIVNHMTVSDGTNQIINAIEKPLSNIAINIINVLCVIVLFFGIFIIVKRLIHVALKLFNIPIIKQVNMIFGGFLGAVEGVVFVFFAANIFYVIVTFAQPDILSDDLFSGQLFKFFCSFY